MRVRIGVMFQSVFYSPFYVALHRGFFEREGIDLTHQTLGGGKGVTAAQQQGEVDIGIGGIMRSLEAFDRGTAKVPVHFAKINDRDGFFLLGRDQAFDWPDLIGRRLILFAEAPTPWYILRAHLIDRGLDPDRVTVISDRPVDQVAAAFRAGEADYLEAPAPVAEELVRDGSAVILKSMGRETGPLPYSSYSAMPEVFDRRPDAIEAVARAHVAALHWMQSSTGSQIWEAVRPSFGAGDPEILLKAVERYQALGVWSCDGTISRADIDRLAGKLQRGGLIGRIAPYEVVCNDEPVRQAIARLPSR